MLETPRFSSMEYEDFKIFLKLIWAHPLSLALNRHRTKKQ